MADFSHLKESLAVSGETTREYVFGNIEGEPSLMVSPANDENKDYQDTRLRLALEASDRQAGSPRTRAPKKITPEDMVRQMDEDRDFDRKVIAQACVRGWGTPPVDNDGNAVEFSVENAYDFLCAIPNYMFDPFRNFAQNVLNFMPRKADGEELGNS